MIYLVFIEINMIKSLQGIRPSDSFNLYQCRKQRGQLAREYYH